jgi:DNA repair exonuclease SbcCD ATPase subunit
VDLADVADELYALLPGDFTAERNERAKQLKAEGDADLAAAVRSLPKPTTAAWLVNQLVRHHGDEVEQVAQVGAALREAQEGLEKEELLQLNKQRQAVLRAVTRQARALANELGNPVSTAIADEVEHTLRAVMSDPDAAAAVRSGTVLRSLSSTGFGAVDLSDAVALGDAAARRRPSPKRASAGAGSRGAATQGTATPRGKGKAATGKAAKGKAAKDEAAKGEAAKDELAERRRQHEREKAERERRERMLAEARQAVEEAEAQAEQADDALDEAQAAVERLAQRTSAVEHRLAELEREVSDAQQERAAVQRETRTAERDREAARHDSEAAHRALDRARQRVERLS